MFFQTFSGKIPLPSFFIGNGGSAATSSHIAVDLSKNAKVKALNFNDADLITCFANDFGHDHWMKEAIKIYSNKKPNEILEIDHQDIFKKFGLEEHLSPQRSNGLLSMIQRIKNDAMENV